MAVSKLFADTKKLFEDESTTAELCFGWREPAKQINQGSGRANRVCFIPGDGDDAGKDAPARNPGNNPASLATLLELVTISCWAVDTDEPDNELAQYEAVRLLYDAVRRSVAINAEGTYHVTKVRWNLKDIERGFGAEVRFVVELEAMVPDLPLVEVKPTASIGAYLNNDPDNEGTLDSAGATTP